MSPQDSMLLQDFLNQLVQVRGVPKDPDAESLIARAVAQQPDAAYLLVQRALLQQQALNNAQAEIAALQQQMRGAPRSAPEFLDPNAWGHGGQRSPALSHGAPQQQMSSQHYPPAYQQPSRSGFFGGRMGGMGGALGSIASTAAGVAAGAFLFQGLGNLFDGNNNDGNGFLGNDNAFSSLTSPLDNLGANNLGDSSGASDTSSSLADSSASEHDFSSDSGGDSFGGDSFDSGGDDSMLG
ncbi:DUF2076 domain-containing protein [Massilia niabensis]|uniref:DUF2076 domain-containing protein n=1 Tax=Massilia niabensis TaxID=544910 RepID=A0ABW0L9X3_9BURK